MALFKRYQPSQPVSERQPDEKGLLPWVQRELYPFIQQTQRFLVRCISYMGMGGVDLTDFPDVAENKLIAGAGVTITKTGAEGERQLVFSANPTTSPPVPPPSPVVTLSSLYTARIGNANYRAPCKCHLYFAQGIGWRSDQWTNVSGTSTWIHNVAGAVLGYGGGGATLPLNAGDRVYIATDVVTGTWQPSPYIGIYEVLYPGSDETPGIGSPSPYAIIRRAIDADSPIGLNHGMSCKVTIGLSGQPDYPVITTADPIVVNTTVITVTDFSTWHTIPYTDVYELLTGPQLTSEGASNETVEFSASAVSTSGYVEQALPEAFATIAGTPGVDSLAAGPYQFDIEAIRVSGASTGSITTLRAYLIELLHDGGVVIADSPPLVSATNVPTSFIATLASPYAFSPTNRLEVRYHLRTNSTTTVTLTMRYNSPARGTKITLPFEMPVTGAITGRHDDLSGRDTVNNHFGVGTCTTVSGIVPVPTKTTMVVTISGNPFLSGMHMEGLQTGIPVELTFLQACHLIEEDGTLASGVARFLSSHMDGSSPDQIDIAAGGRVGLRFFATELPQSPCFQLTWGPVS